MKQAISIMNFGGVLVVAALMAGCAKDNPDVSLASAKGYLAKTPYFNAISKALDPRFGNRQTYSLRNCLQVTELGQVTALKRTRFCACIH